MFILWRFPLRQYLPAALSLSPAPKILFWRALEKHLRLCSKKLFSFFPFTAEFISVNNNERIALYFHPKGISIYILLKLLCVQNLGAMTPGGMRFGEVGVASVLPAGVRWSPFSTFRHSFPVRHIIPLLARLPCRGEKLSKGKRMEEDSWFSLLAFHKAIQWGSQQEVTNCSHSQWSFCFSV